MKIDDYVDQARAAGMKFDEIKREILIAAIAMGATQIRIAGSDDDAVKVQRGGYELIIRKLSDD